MTQTRTPKTRRDIDTAVKIYDTPRLLDLHRTARRQVRALPADYLVRRPHCLVLLAIEAELDRRGLEAPSRLAA